MRFSLHNISLGEGNTDSSGGYSFIFQVLVCDLRPFQFPIFNAL